MSYFNFTGVNCAHYQVEWDAVITQIQGWPSKYRDYKHPLPKHISYHLEAKALYVFTMARRLVHAAYRLGEAKKGNWKLIFVEATSLLFPMIELVGHARLGGGNNSNSLWAGIRWLHNPYVPLRPPGDPQADSTPVPTLLKLEVGHLVALRHYYLHGSKKSTRLGASIAGIMSYRLPQAIVKRAEEVIPEYWKQLKEDDGSQEWVERLARADIRPLKIQGSGVFEAGLIDPDIVDYLESA